MSRESIFYKQKRFKKCLTFQKDMPGSEQRLIPREPKEITDILSQPIFSSRAEKMLPIGSLLALTTLAVISEYMGAKELLSCLDRANSNSNCALSEYAGHSLIMTTIAATTIGMIYIVGRLYKLDTEPKPRIYYLSRPEELLQDRP